MTIVRRVVALTLGWERLPKSISVHGDDSGAVLVEPVPAIALDTDEGWWLLDTGFNTALIRDRLLYERFHGRSPEVGVILPDGDGEPLRDELARHGVALEDVRRIVLSHLHNDHAGFIGCTAEDALQPILRLKAIAAERNLPLVPGHDPDAWPALSAELA